MEQHNGAAASLSLSLSANRRFRLPARFLMVHLVGDRDNPYFSIKPYAFTVPANPMSDRDQRVIIVYETQ